MLIFGFVFLIFIQSGQVKILKLIYIQYYEQADTLE